MKIMKLTSMKSFVFLSGLKHTHKSDVCGASLENHFLVSKVAWMTGTGEQTQPGTHHHSQHNPSGCPREEPFCIISLCAVRLTLKTRKQTADVRTQ